ncbi:hypothetical protein ETB97_008873 [Aspergillus alliaceus]|uniref:ATPase AAA-type core domain-containing protein n=1 Tax=Petromyces alliaceus TaxID=209559 RepID=A0A8H5ZUY6_PETAA|nr:hypothetical protein ETB97_008873 [Aspergillus burnettii]
MAHPPGLIKDGYKVHPCEGIIFKDLKTTQDSGPFGSWRRYGQRKLANILYALGLARRYPGLITISIPLGVVNTGLVENLDRANRWFVYATTFNQTVIPGENGQFYIPDGVPSNSQLDKTTQDGLSSIWQLFFDQDLIYEVEATYPYNANNVSITTNADDHVVQDEIEDTASDPFFECTSDFDHGIQDDDLGPDVMGNESLLKTSFLLLLPHEIHGFGFSIEKWRALQVERIRDIDWNEMSSNDSSFSKSSDVIEGKGNALIMLLHGGPGTGKTLTAVSVAELTKKPLYRVTWGDIGTNADEIERYLETVLLIGTIWGCVVLLDEAVVFLEEPRETDLQPNALVSVFRRIPARGALSPVGLEGPYEIWLNFINGLSKTNPDVNIDDLKNHLVVLAADCLNGRQIRNTVRTALQLASFWEETLDYRHFEGHCGK